MVLYWYGAATLLAWYRYGIGIVAAWRLGKALALASIGVVLIWYLFGSGMSYVW